MCAVQTTEVSTLWFRLLSVLAASVLSTQSPCLALCLMTSSTYFVRNVGMRINPQSGVQLFKRATSTDKLSLVGPPKSTWNRSIYILLYMYPHVGETMCSACYYCMLACSREKLQAMQLYPSSSTLLEPRQLRVSNGDTSLPPNKS